MKKLIFVTILCTFVWLGLAGCNDDCPTCPEPPDHVPDYHLLYAYEGQYPNLYVLTYSTRTGKIIDSAYYHGNIFKSMDFSHDGQYACYTTDDHVSNGYSETWITDFASGDTISYRQDIGGHGVVISPNDNFVLVTGSKLLAVLRFPSLETIYLDSVGAWVGSFRDRQPVIYVSLADHLDSMYVLDLESEAPSMESFPINLYDGTPAECLGPTCISDSLLVLLCRNRLHRYLQIYNLRNNELIWQEIANSDPYLGAALQQSTKRLYLAYNGGFDHPVGGIDVLDLNSRVYRSYLAPGEILLGFDAFVPSALEITPDGSTMYVLSGDHGFWLGPILEIDIATKEVTRRIDNLDGNSWFMRLNPKDWAK